MHRLHTLLACSAAAALSACGGGGDSATPTAGAALTLSASNYERATIESSAASIEVVSLGAESGAASFLGAETSAPIHWASVGRRELVRADALFQTNVGAAFVGAVKTVTSGCYTFTVDDKNGNQAFDTGDSIAVTFNQCQINGDTVTGVLTLVPNSASTGNLSGSVYSADITMTFTGFKSVGPSLTAQADGSLRLVTVHTSSTAGRDTVSTAGFQSSVTAGGTSYARTLNAFTGTVVTAGTESEVSVSGTVTSTALEGRSLTIATPTPFKQRNTDNYPYVGVVTVTGANGGKATLSTLSTSQVSISLDANGDGTAETNVVKAWSAIQ